MARLGTDTGRRPLLMRNLNSNAARKSLFAPALFPSRPSRPMTEIDLSRPSAFYRAWLAREKENFSLV